MTATIESRLDGFIARAHVAGFEFPTRVWEYAKTGGFVSREVKLKDKVNRAICISKVKGWKLPLTTKELLP